MRYNILFADRRTGKVTQFMSVTDRVVHGLELAEVRNRIQILLINESGVMA